jgi:hypothetical protein
MQIRNTIMLLAEGDAQPAAAPAAPAPRESTFAERKAAQLRDERAAAPPEREPAPAPETAPATPLEPVLSEQGDGYPELLDSGEQAPLEDDGSDLYEETPEPLDLQGDEGEPTVDWEKRYKDTQAELTRASEERQERNNEHAEMMAGSLKLQYDLEDNLGKARNYTNYYVEGITNQITQMEQAFNSGQIDPERMQEARQQYHNLQQQKGQMQARLDQIESTESEAKAVKKKREAEITRVRLQRTIPDWSEAKYNAMRSEAVSRGYTEKEYADITDYRFFEMLNDSMTLRSASDAIGSVTQKKRVGSPRGRRNAQAPRDSRGRYEKTKRDFHANPNQKGRFAEMKAQELSRERSGR